MTSVNDSSTVAASASGTVQRGARWKRGGATGGCSSVARACQHGAVDGLVRPVQIRVELRHEALLALQPQFEFIVAIHGVHDALSSRSVCIDSRSFATA
jgi:hypothetical protein